MEMHSPDEVAERILASMRELFDELQAELADVPEDVLADARLSLHDRAKSIAGRSLADPEEVQRAETGAPGSPPEKWVSWTATTMGVALLQAKRLQ